MPLPLLFDTPLAPLPNADGVWLSFKGASQIFPGVQLAEEQANHVGRMKVFTSRYMPMDKGFVIKDGRIIATIEFPEETSMAEDDCADG